MIKLKICWCPNVPSKKNENYLYKKYEMSFGINRKDEMIVLVLVVELSTLDGSVPPGSVDFSLISMQHMYNLRILVTTLSPDRA